MARRADQSCLHEPVPPRVTGNRLFCHEEFLEKMDENRANTVGRRAALLLQRLHVNQARPYYKPTQGENRGWRRSPLGGNHGSHFYAWWAPRGAQPVAGNPQFEDAGEGSVFLRAIRHHDDHTPLNPQSLADNYLPVGFEELRHQDMVPAPWTAPQAKFAEARQKIRIIKGSPGSGKTTALWHATDKSCRQAALYVTYSNELAALAQEHFDRFEPGNQRFHVVTFSRLLRETLKVDAPFQPVRQARTDFVKEIAGFSSTILGPWLNHRGALYDEIHAHLMGGALPVAVGRFPGIPDRRISARQYRELREDSIGRNAAEAAVEIAETLRRRDAHPEQRFFAELDLAWKAVQHLRASGPGVFAEFDCLALDEAQDLTPIEALVIVELARCLGKDLTFLIAGDEAQTVRPTDFEWGWFHDLLHHRLASPFDVKLQVNLRSPVRIATLVNRAWDLYGSLAKQERPSGSGVAEIDENAGDQIIYCTAKSGPELDDLLTQLSNREGLAIVTPGDEMPDYLSPELRHRVLTSVEAKGLDFQSVCVLDAGKSLDRVLQASDHGRTQELDDLTRRLHIDQLRVVLSRPAERLFWLDVNPNDRVLARAREMLTFYGETVHPVVPAVVLKTLEEDTLDIEERVRLCQQDALQLLSVRPALACSRARQALALLGERGGKFSVTDPEARRAAAMTMCQVAFTLAMRRVALPSEMGRADLFAEAAAAAENAGRPHLGLLIQAISSNQRNYSNDKFATMLHVGMALKSHRAEVDPWMLQELQPWSAAWIRHFEDEITRTPDMANEILPTLYDLFTPLEAEPKKARLKEQTLRSLICTGLFPLALKILKETPDADPKLVAQCHEGMGQLELAASEYLRANSPADALRCYRRIPDFDKSLELVDRMGDDPARESLLWVRQMRDLAARRPADFTKVMLPAEKKLLEEILQTSLGVSRKKPAARKSAATKPGKKAAPRKTVPNAPHR